MLPLLYGIVIIFAIFPGLAGIVGLKALQVEGLLLCILILIAHMLAWEFMSNS